MDTEKIERLTDAKALGNLMKNARARGREDIRDAAFRRLVSLEGMDLDGSLERDFYEVLNAYEELLTEKNERTTKASRTRQKLANKGVRQCLVDWAVGPATEGFELLADRGLYELTAEYLVLKHANEFPEAAVENARQRLSSKGFSVRFGAHVTR